MARSTCVKCGNHQFKVVAQDRVKNSSYKLNFVQCAACGTVVGVMEYYNLGAMINKILQKLGIS